MGALNNALFGAVVVCFGAAGWQTARATGRLRSALEVAALVWAVSTVIGLFALRTVTFAGMDVIRQNTFMLEDFARSGARDIETFIVEDALGASLFGSVAALVAGAGCAVAGALLDRRTRGPAAT